MSLQEFLKDYKFEFNDQVVDRLTFIAITKVIRRSDNKEVSRVKNATDIYEINDFISASQSPFSFNVWDWSIMIDQIKRMQLDYFAQVMSIENFYPMNSETPISTCYI